MKNYYSFDCPDFTAYDTNKCHYMGKTFNVGDSIEDDIAPDCRADCGCRKYKGIAYINCAEIECFEDDNLDLDVDVDVDLNCILQYDDPRQCCSTSKICGN